MVWKKLPRGSETPLEKLPDPQELLAASELKDPQENFVLTEEEVQIMRRLWQELDGLLSVAGTIKKLSDITTQQAAAAVNRLLLYHLVTVPATDLSVPMDKYRIIVGEVAQHLGLERSCALLRLSLQASQGYSVKARMFSIGSAGEVGVDLALARSAGVSLTNVIRDLDDWQVKFIEYVSHELDKSVLRDIVYRVHRLA